MTYENRGASRAADVSNPFVTKDSALVSSPMKMRSGADDMAALREGVSRMNILDRSGGGDYALPEPRAKESRDYKGRDLDRFVPSRSSNGSSLFDDLTPDGSFNDRSSTSLSGTGTAPNRRILSFRAAPPPASHSSHLDAQRNYLLHSSAASNRGVGTAGAGAMQTKKRTPPYIPDKVLDAPGFVDDYYLNLVEWSTANRVAIGLADTPYVWDADSGAVVSLGDDEAERPIVCSVSWSPDGAYLAVGNEDGAVEIWDVEENKRMRVMSGHNARIPSLSWNGHLLSSGCRDGTIFHHDVRVAQHKVAELRGHVAEVCGLKWRPDGQLLASGGNDNVVNCWDSRVGASIIETETQSRIVPKWTKRNHTAAVKALAWCPWQPNLLATGGGSADKHIHFWSTTTGARSGSLNTGSQVTSIIWSPHAKELLSTHGYPDNNLSLWSYPSLTKIYDVPAHDNRVLASTLSPDGCTVATGAGDENLKFWKIWTPKAASKKGDDDRDARGQTRGRIR